MAGSNKMSGAESRESIRAPTAATACGEKHKIQDSKRLAPEDDSQAQLREEFHLCSPRVGEEAPGPEMQAGGQPEKF